MLPGGTDERTNEQGKIELLSQWKLEAEFHNYIQIVKIRLAHRLYTDVQYFLWKNGIF